MRAESIPHALRISVAMKQAEEQHSKTCHGFIYPVYKEQRQPTLIPVKQCNFIGIVWGSSQSKQEDIQGS